MLYRIRESAVQLYSMKRLNIRLSDEAAASLEAKAEEIACSQTVIIERLLTLPQSATLSPKVVQHSVAEPELLQRIYERQNQIQITLEEVLETVQRVPETRPSGFDPASIPGVLQGAAGLPKNAFCKHCGNRFAGSKWATLCPDCQANGHRNVLPADCGECRTSGTGGL